MVQWSLPSRVIVGTEWVDDHQGIQGPPLLSCVRCEGAWIDFEPQLFKVSSPNLGPQGRVENQLWRTSPNVDVSMHTEGALEGSTDVFTGQGWVWEQMSCSEG